MRRWLLYVVRDDLVRRVDVFETQPEALEAAGRRE
jgi:hypothetical protein